ncbi:MAG TPA: putative metal-dependent hydrolase [Methylomirabilota bacterium]|nr:putative metal-dependent hydrolase [Methylomirabilota bacterium]
MANEAAAVDLQYPIGKLVRKSVLTPEERRIAIEQIAEAPGRLCIAVAGLTPAQLDTPYREGGWTVRQVVHHLADSHLNSFVRFKLALTEQEPTIKPYDQDLWARLPDSELPIEISLSLLTALHQRWVALLQSMKPADFARRLRHPEMGVVTLDGNVGMYSWHCRHHVAHITALRQRMGWN